MIIIDDIKKQAKEYNIHFWEVPDFLLIMATIFNIIVMISTYWWFSVQFEDTRYAVFFVSLEAALITVIGNVIVESAKKILAMGQLKKEFVEILSHQLRTPLATIKWHMEMLLKNHPKNLTTKQLDYMEVVVDSNGKMLSLINDLLNMVNIEKGSAEYNIETIDLIEIIDEAIKNQGIFSQSKNQKVIFKKKNYKKFMVIGDRMKLKVILDNLLSNAIKYTPKEGKIILSLQKVDEKIIFCCKDNGIGIQEKEKKLIFEKFYRTRDTRKMEIQGTGLGLYICKVLLEGMSGQIWFKSKFGRGSSFFFSLPVAK